mgnify:CR=1 FL=1
MPLSTAKQYSPAEAAILSGLALKAVHNAIDKQILKSVAAVPGKRSRRSLTADDILRLKLWSQVGPILTQERRERLFEELSERPTATKLKADDLVIVDVGEARRQIEAKARDLEEAEAAVTQLRSVKGGEPVFAGTRIPVRLVASMIEDGADRQEILEGYPKLEQRHLDLAVIWAKAHPRRGRPKTLADRGVTVRSTSRRSISPDPGPVKTRKSRSA